MDQKMFLQLDGVPGESEDPRHRGEIEILGFTWGGSYLQSTGGRGRASFNDLSVVKRVSKSSHFLFIASNSGRNFTDGVLTVENLSREEKVVRTTRIELGSIRVSTFTSDGKTDSFGLNFSSIRMVG